jgi:hypothetical protein
LTISTIGYEYATSKGCFNDLSLVKGGLREFIQKSVKGGRVFVNPEYQGEEIDKPIEDFDGVSLYPSSMKRLCQEYGLPVGKIKRGTTQTYEYYEAKTWYVVRIIINKINKKQQIPCVSIKDKESLKYVNEINKPIEVYVDKTTLNDYINFQHIDYEIIEGVYWDEGFNKRLGDVIQKLHEDRCVYKQTNKPLASMIKLIMNSIYGKTGQRSSETETVFVGNEKVEQYIYDHYGVISSWEQTAFNTKIVKRKFDTSYSLNYVASSILSMSKRIMNEVFSVMNDANMPVYYTDTDSIHMNQSDVLELGKQYTNVYGKELIGKNLGQFHTDFDMDGCTDVFSIKHIPLKPKIYLDILQGTDKKTGETKYDTHVRIKGITSAGIEQQIKVRQNEGVDRINATLNLFRDLKNGKMVNFVMNPTDFDVCFEFSLEGVKTRKVGWVRSMKLTENNIEENDF